MLDETSDPSQRAQKFEAETRKTLRPFYDSMVRQDKQAIRRAGQERVVCEVNTIPPNPESDALHAALGFVEVGTASIHGGSKTVRYLERRLF